MKKLQTLIGTVAIAAVLTLVGCANPNNDSADFREDGKVKIPVISTEATVETVTLEKQNFSGNQKAAVTKDNIKDFMPVLKDFESTFKLVGDNLAKDKLFKSEVLDQVMDKEGKPKNPVYLDLSNKEYTVENMAKLNFTKLKEFFKETIEGGNPEDKTPPTKVAYNALADIDGKIDISGTGINKIPYLDDVSKKEKTKDNTIKSIKANVKTYGGANLDERPNFGLEGAITTALNGKAAFETEKVAGYVSLDCKVTVKDFNAVYNKVMFDLQHNETLSPVVEKLAAYVQWYIQNIKNNVSTNAPEFLTNTELKTLYDWIKTFDITAIAKITFTDTNDENPYDLLKIDNLSDLATLLINFIKPNIKE